MASTPSSTTSGCVSGEDTSEDHLLPSGLATEELQLALNKEAVEPELETAIARCKELVLECENNSTERKWLVRHLIELRLRLQECKEAKLDPRHPRNKSSGVSKRTVRGHHLHLQPLLKNVSRYCDHCTGSIWHVVQAWYQCEDCGYSVHHKCMSMIIRECAHVVASEKGEYEWNICPEEGLSAQKYACFECEAPLPVDPRLQHHLRQKIVVCEPKTWKSIGTDQCKVVSEGNNWSYCDPQRCDYTGRYYCSACHWGNMAITPARVIHNWDFEPRLVCQASLQLLKITIEKPFIPLERLNPKLFTRVHELNLVKRIRGELMQMRKYLLVCRNAERARFLWKNVGTPHLIESADLYSLQDLADTNSGELPTKLLNLASIFAQHIKETCEVCKGRGHICEICSNDEVLYPFDQTAYICQDCNAVLHKNCFGNRAKGECPKCKRLLKRLEEKNKTDDGENV